MHAYTRSATSYETKIKSQRLLFAWSPLISRLSRALLSAIGPPRPKNTPDTPPGLAPDAHHTGVSNRKKWRSRSARQGGTTASLFSSFFHNARTGWRPTGWGDARPATNGLSPGTRLRALHRCEMVGVKGEAQRRRLDSSGGQHYKVARARVARIQSTGASLESKRSTTQDPPSSVVKSCVSFLSLCPHCCADKVNEALQPVAGISFSHFTVVCKLFRNCSGSRLDKRA